MATPWPPLGRQSANLLATFCARDTCAGSDTLERASPATPTAPAGSLASSECGALAATAGKETGWSGFSPSVSLAVTVTRVRSPEPALRAKGL